MRGGRGATQKKPQVSTFAQVGGKIDINLFSHYQPQIPLRHANLHQRFLPVK